MQKKNRVQVKSITPEYVQTMSGNWKKKDLGRKEGELPDIMAGANL